MALGARRRDILALVTRQGLLATSAGILLGAVGADALGQYLNSQSCGVDCDRRLDLCRRRPGAGDDFSGGSFDSRFRGAARYDPAIALRVP